jgi:curli biogenesis system outer membrane secretion channel CsgG
MQTKPEFDNHLTEKMKRNLLSFTSALILTAVGISRALADDEGLPTVFVPPFSGDTTAIAYWQPALGAGLSEMLITELGKLNKFQVLESTQLEALKDEIKMGDDGWVDQSEKVDKGGFAAADFMFNAKVTRFGSKDTQVGLGGFVPGSLGSLGVRQTTSDVRLDWRLVDVATRKIIKTGSSTASQKGGGFTIGADVKGHGGGIGFDNQEFMDSALGKATVKALAQITADLAPITLPESGRHKKKAAAAGKEAAAANALTETLHQAPGKVLAVADKDTIIVSLGSKNGFKAGDKLNLYEVADVKNDKGEVVFSDEKLVGEVTIQSTQDDRSKVSYAGDKDVKPGWTVKAK